MTIQTFVLLRRLSRVQQDEDGLIGYDGEGFLVNVHDQDETPRRMSLQPYETRIFSMLDSLQRDGLVEHSFRDGGDIWVTHEGLHLRQHILWLFLHSVALPAAVAFLTSLITVLVNK